MKYIITSINIEKNTATTYQTISSGPVTVSGSSELSVSVGLLILEHKSSELRDLDAFEMAIKGDNRIQTGAPTYMELLEKHNPEFLL